MSDTNPDRAPARDAYSRHLPHLPSDLRLHVEGQEPAALARQVLALLL